MPNPILLFSAILALVVSGHSLAMDTLCTDQPRRLAAHRGQYANQEVLDQVEKERVWAPPYTVSALSISAEGIVTFSYSWHETATTKELGLGNVCFDVGTQSLVARADGRRFRLLRDSAAFDDDGPYLRRLFPECYLDEHRREWCLRDGALQIEGEPRSARLVMDSSESPAGGVTLQVAGDDLLWHFVPHGRRGWHVHRTGWASAKDYEPVEKRVPWRTLKPKAR